MTKRRTILTVSLLLFSGIAAVWLLRSTEPEYDGRTVTEWLEDHVAGKRTHHPTAIHTIGTNALPWITRQLARNESVWYAQYARWQPTFPSVIQKWLPQPRRKFEVVHGVNAFLLIGTNAIPDLILLLKHRSSSVRQAAALGLGSLRRETEDANRSIPALIETLEDSDRMVRTYAALAFMRMGPDGSNAVPALTKLVQTTGVGSETNEYFSLRAAAACALGNIGPSAKDAMPELRAAMQESNAYLRGQSAVAVWRIDSDVDAALPVLLELLPTISEHAKWDWIIALGEMGPLASNAIPQLEQELITSQQAGVLNYVTNALLSIDPSWKSKSGGPRKVSPTSESKPIP